MALVYFSYKYFAVKCSALFYVIMKRQTGRETLQPRARPVTMNCIHNTRLHLSNAPIQAITAAKPLILLLRILNDHRHPNVNLPYAHSKISVGSDIGEIACEPIFEQKTCVQIINQSIKSIKTCDAQASLVYPDRCLRCDGRPSTPVFGNAEQ